MPKYLFQVNYVGEGIKGLLKEGGSSRKAAVEDLFKSLGGTIEAYYFAFGETDLYIIGNLPDNASAAAGSLLTASTGTVAVKTTILLSPEELDAAAKKTPHFRPAGA